MRIRQLFRAIAIVLVCCGIAVAASGSVDIRDMAALQATMQQSVDRKTLAVRVGNHASRIAAPLTRYDSVTDRQVGRISSFSGRPTNLLASDELGTVIDAFNDLQRRVSERRRGSQRHTDGYAQRMTGRAIPRMRCSS